jgi:hypothetical protein
MKPHSCQCFVHNMHPPSVASHVLPSPRLPSQHQVVTNEITRAHLCKEGSVLWQAKWLLQTDICFAAEATHVGTLHATSPHVAVGPSLCCYSTPCLMALYALATAASAVCCMAALYRDLVQQQVLHMLQMMACQGGTWWR